MLVLNNHPPCSAMPGRHHREPRAGVAPYEAENLVVPLDGDEARVHRPGHHELGSQDGTARCPDGRRLGTGLRLHPVALRHGGCARRSRRGAIHSARALGRASMGSITAAEAADLLLLELGRSVSRDPNPMQEEAR